MTEFETKILHSLELISKNLEQICINLVQLNDPTNAHNENLDRIADILNEHNRIAAGPATYEKL
jgi:hypothetical protein